MTTSEPNDLICLGVRVVGSEHQMLEVYDQKTGRALAGVKSQNVNEQVRGPSLLTLEVHIEALPDNADD